jgi:hypothetical protein
VGGDRAGEFDAEEHVEDRLHLAVREAVFRVEDRGRGLGVGADAGPQRRYDRSS